MAINWRAGLDEIEKSGQIASQGFGQMAQFQQQKANVMTGLAQEKRRIIEQNQATKRQENQQIFDAAISTANTFANVMQRQQQMDREKAQDAINQEKLGWERADREQKMQGLKGAEEALIKTNKPGLTRNENESDSAFAARIQTTQTLKDSEEERARAAKNDALNEEVKRSDIDYKKTQSDLAKRSADQKDQELAIQRTQIEQQASAVAQNDAGKRLDGVRTALQNAADPNAYYNAQPEETRKAQSKGLDAARTSAAQSSLPAATLNRFMSMFGKTPQKDGTYSPADIQSAAQQAQNLKGDDPRMFELDMIGGQLWLAARQSMKGQGQISDAESSTAAKAFGTGALENINAFQQLSQVEQGYLRNIRTFFVKEISGEAGVQALTKELAKKSSEAKDGVLRQFVTNDGFYAIPPKQRAEALYETLSPQQKQAIPYERFVLGSTQEQLTLAFGADRVKTMDLTAMNRADASARDPSAVMDAIVERERKTIITAKGISASESKRINQEYQDDVAIAAQTYRGPSRPAPGVPSSAASIGTPLKAAPGGGTEPIRDNTNTPPYVGNPLDASEWFGQNMSFKGGKFQNTGTASRGGAPAQSRGVNMGAFGGK